MAPVRTIVASIACAAAVTGCSGEHEWRELQWPDGGFAVMLPGRPSKETRPVTIGAQTLSLTLLPVRVEPFVYGVGYADLPPGLTAAARLQLLNDAKVSLLANVGATPRAERSNTLEGSPCLEFEAHGRAEGRAFAMTARVCLIDQRYLQLVAIAPEARATDLDGALFLGSLKRLKP